MEGFGDLLVDVEEFEDLRDVDHGLTDGSPHGSKEVEGLVDLHDVEVDEHEVANFEAALGNLVGGKDQVEQDTERYD